VGETHLQTNSYFTNAIINEVKFDAILRGFDLFSGYDRKIKSLEQLNSLLKNTQANFEVAEPEFALLKNLVKRNTKIYGAEQMSFCRSNDNFKFKRNFENKSD
jgi:hypothetical protein